jgi:hypothetical protein
LSANALSMTACLVLVVQCNISYKKNHP